jgi:hypothetical protein
MLASLAYRMAGLSRSSERIDATTATIITDLHELAPGASRVSEHPD